VGKKILRGENGEEGELQEVSIIRGNRACGGLWALLSKDAYNSLGEEE